MKKFSFIIAAMMVSMSTICVFTSCSEDDDCTCKEVGQGYSSTRTLDPKSYGATNCSDLEIKLRMAAGYDSDFDYYCN